MKLTILLLSISCVLHLKTTEPLKEAQKYLNKQNIDELIFVSITEQKLHHTKNSKVIKSYIISSSAYGTGNRAGSNKTPLGLHNIKEKHGEKTPVNGRMIGRVFYGDIAVYCHMNFDKL